MNPLIEAVIRSDTPSDAGNPDLAAIKAAIDQLHDRFVDERVNGFTDPRTGQFQPGVPPEQAEARWQKSLPMFQKVLLQTASQQNDPGNRRLGLSRNPLPASSDYHEGPESDDWNTALKNQPGAPMDPAEYEPGWGKAPGARADRAQRDEPSLRRGESKARRIISKLMA